MAALEPAGGSILLPRQHIQNHSAEGVVHQSYLFYPSRIVPCQNDAGSCAYLDVVYNGQNVTMHYTFIMWYVLLGTAFLWLLLRGWRSGGPEYRVGNFIDRSADRVNTWFRRYLLADAPWRWLFGRISRVQLATLGVITVYLTIFSFVGLYYGKWVTPVRTDPGYYNTRTSLGPWGNRVGAFAYALTPFSVLLAMRESWLSMITGIPYQHFNFLHRWLGYIIFAQSALHSLAWFLIEAWLYQPQPRVMRNFMAQMYAIFGVVAMFLLTLLLVLSTGPCRRWFGYEFFKISHWVIAVLYIGACWGHWDKLYIWMLPALILIAIDQFTRGGRILYLHWQGKSADTPLGSGFKCAQANVKVFHGDDGGAVVRLDFDYPHRSAWKPGQHFYLTFPALSIFQAHPMTPVSLPDESSTMQHHTYIIRALKGQTAKLAALGDGAVTPVILTGPYGNSHPLHETRNVLCVSGGTGVTFSLPIANAALSQWIVPQAHVQCTWVVRTAEDLLWCGPELARLKALLPTTPSLNINLFVTRKGGKDRLALPENGYKEKHAAGSISSSDADDSHSADKIATTATATENNGHSSSETSSELSQDKSASASSSLTALLAPAPRFTVTYLSSTHPSIQDIVSDFSSRAETYGGNIEVVGSGPAEMGSDLRKAVAGMRVFGDTDRRGRAKEVEIGVYWDDRN